MRLSAGIAGLAHMPTTNAQERRRHQRVRIALLGRYMLADRREFPCQTIDMSPGGVALFAPVRGEIGQRVIVYLDQIGRLEGTITRHVENGFALQMNVPLMKREKLADQLTWLANRQSLGMPEDRRHERIVPRQTRYTLTLGDGRQFPSKVTDISLSGVALRTDIQPAIGSPVTVGATSGAVVRHLDGGFAVEFARLLPADTFDETVTL